MCVVYDCIARCHHGNVLIQRHPLAPKETPKMYDQKGPWYQRPLAHSLARSLALLLVHFPIDHITPKRKRRRMALFDTRKLSQPPDDRRLYVPRRLRRGRKQCPPRGRTCPRVDVDLVAGPYLPSRITGPHVRNSHPLSTSPSSLQPYPAFQEKKLPRSA